MASTKVLPASDYALYVGTTVVAAGAVLGAYFLVRGQVRKVQETNVEKQGLAAGTAANWAKRLKMGFDNDLPFGWGTNEQAVYAVFKELPSKAAYGEVQKAYTTLYHADLNADLQKELSSSEFAQVSKIFNSKKAK